jgi:hypothetical protein
VNRNIELYIEIIKTSTYSIDIDSSAVYWQRE